MTAAGHGLISHNVSTEFTSTPNWHTQGEQELGVPVQKKPTCKPTRQREPCSDVMTTWENRSDSQYKVLKWSQTLQRFCQLFDLLIFLIQFNSVYLYSPISKIRNLPQRALQSIHIWHPWPRTSHQIRKNCQEIEKTLFTGKKVKKPSGEQQRTIPLQDGQKNRCHVTRRNHYRVTTQSMSMTECMNSS